MDLTPTICTYTGREFAPLTPDPGTVDILDIAHALANICRYTGHVSEFWSVAAHSIEVSLRLERIFSPMLGFVGLLHDASEAYLVDVPRPLKPYFVGYAANEARLEETIFAHFGLPYPMPAAVKAIDDSILLDEIANFFKPDSFLWRRYGIVSSFSHPRLRPLDPKLGKRRYLQRFDELQDKIRRGVAA